MARMKIEVQAARAEKYGLSLRDRLIGWMPRYAPYAARLPWLFNAARRYPVLQGLSERSWVSARARTLPQWRADVFDGSADSAARGPRRRAATDKREVVLLADTFNRYFERENLDAAVTRAARGRLSVHVAKPADGRSARSAAAARFSRSARSMRRGAKPSA